MFLTVRLVYCHFHREMSFDRGDVIDLLRQLDMNWYEGQLNGRKGIIPSNYIEVVLNKPVLLTVWP